jgi:hypothetical protein
LQQQQQQVWGCCDHQWCRLEALTLLLLLVVVVVVVHPQCPALYRHQMAVQR